MHALPQEAQRERETMRAIDRSGVYCEQQRDVDHSPGTVIPPPPIDLC